MATEIEAAQRQHELDAKAVDRLVFFSDAVIAIVITLMVLEVRLPALPEHATDAQVVAALIALWPKYFAVVLSFLVIGLYWTLHHRRFNFVRRVDSQLVWLNLIFLLTMACVPFATALVAEHPDLVGTVVYAATLAILSITAALVWWAVGRRPEIRADPAARREMRIAVVMGLLSAAFFSVSIAVAFVSTLLAKGLWLLFFLANRVAGRLSFGRPAK
jgi:uncharacterized membrane protein